MAELLVCELYDILVVKKNSAVSGCMQIVCRSSLIDVHGPSYDL